MHHWSITCSIIHFEWDRPFVAALRGVSAACTPWLSTVRVRGGHVRVSEVPAGPRMRRSQAVGRFGLAYLGLRGWISPVPVRVDKLLHVSVGQAKCFITCWSTGWARSVLPAQPAIDPTATSRSPQSVRAIPVSKAHSRDPHRKAFYA